MLDKGIVISIVIPCFNEAEGISNLAYEIQKLEEKLNEPHELIFIDDGSSDSTYERLTDLYRDRIGKDVKILKHPQNKGVGAVIKTGILNSEGYYVATIDSDCTYELMYLLKMLDIIKKEMADIITASPYHPRGSTLNVPYYRLFLSRNLSRLYNVVLKSNFYTYTSIFRIYCKDAIKNLDFKSDGFLSMAEILIRAYQNGCRIIEYPAVLTGRKFGSSNAKIFKLIREHLCFIMNFLLEREGV